LGALPKGWPSWLVVVVGAYALLLTSVRPANYVDTFNYAKHIVDEYNGTAAQGNPFWDFGHLLWRPMGYLVWGPLHGWLAGLFSGDAVLGAGVALIALSVLGGTAGVIFLFLLLARATGRPWIAVIVTLGFAGTNAILFYSLTGMAYTTGLACQIVALYLIESSSSELSFVKGAQAGAVLGLSILIWFPYILSVPAIVLYALVARAAKFRRRMGGLAGIVAGTAIVAGAVYAAVIVNLRLFAFGAILDWSARARYDKVPARGFLRMLGGIAR